jgi:hypothetical protein
MNKKLLIVFIAALLAFVLSYALWIKKAPETTNENDSQGTIQEVVLEEKESVEEVTEIQKAEDDVVKSENEIIRNTESIRKIVSTSKTEEKDNLPEIERITVKEAGVVEEVQEYGVMKDANGNIIVTRDFKIKSPSKYSYKDYGFLEKVTK